MRIEAGQFKGRRLLSPPPRSITRPITGMVRKSLFGMLAAHVPGAVVLDLYCGAGTLGFEALSRGAAHCCFAERDGAVVGRLRRNIAELGVRDRCTVWRGDVMRRLPGWLNGLASRVDIAFVDPPYAQAEQWDWAAVGRQLFAPLAGALAPEGLVVFRAPAKVSPPEGCGGLAVRRRRRYGQMGLVMLGLPEGDAPGPDAPMPAEHEEP
jgi:16S rRNA (guanine966-N2)-methyltransferase